MENQYSDQQSWLDTVNQINVTIGNNQNRELFLTVLYKAK